MTANLLLGMWKRPTSEATNHNIMKTNLNNDIKVIYNYSLFRVPPILILEVLSLLRQVFRQLLRKRGRVGRMLLARLVALAAGVATVPVVLAISQSAHTQWGLCSIPGRAECFQACARGARVVPTTLSTVAMIETVEVFINMIFTILREHIIYYIKTSIKNNKGL